VVADQEALMSISTRFVGPLEIAASIDECIRRPRYRDVEPDIRTTPRTDLPNLEKFFSHRGEPGRYEWIGFDFLRPTRWIVCRIENPILS
jgi:hypothetical protein